MGGLEIGRSLDADQKIPRARAKPNSTKVYRPKAERDQLVLARGILWVRYAIARSLEVPQQQCQHEDAKDHQDEDSDVLALHRVLE